MLSDEEKEALRNFKSEYETCDHYSSDLIIELDDAEIILNLIEKQSKEIEELKEKNKKLEITSNELNGLADIVIRDYIHKDKIKAKIEPRLKELDEQMKKEWKEYGNSREYQDMEDEWNLLQSLLEKE